VATSTLDVVGRITRLHQQILARMQQPEPIEPAIQQLLGELLNILPYVPRLKNAEINVAQAELAIGALLSANPETQFAETICRGLVRRVDIYKSPLRSILNGRTPATFVLLGVLVHSAILAVAIWILSKVVPCTGNDAKSVCWIPMTIAGAVGGATSLFTRLSEIAALSRWSSEGDPLQLFYTGLIKPVVGIVTGLFTYAAIATGIVTFQVPGQGASPQVLYIASAFLAGFSERFARDVTDTVSTLGKEGQ
jgi:hypothetical protein